MGFLTKRECTRCILVPFRLDRMREELACYVIWYNEHRPHQSLNGMTPAEVYDDEASPNPGVRFETHGHGGRWTLDAMDGANAQVASI